MTMLSFEEGRTESPLAKVEIKFNAVMSGTWVWTKIISDDTFEVNLRCWSV
jgi:hypothetical protein